MPFIQTFLMFLAVVLFFLAMLGVPSSPKFNLMAAGLFCWSLVVLLTQFSGVR